MSETPEENQWIKKVLKEQDELRARCSKLEIALETCWKFSLFPGAAIDGVLGPEKKLIMEIMPNLK